MPLKSFKFYLENHMIAKINQGNTTYQIINKNLTLQQQEPELDQSNDFEDLILKENFYQVFSRYNSVNNLQVFWLVLFFSKLVFYGMPNPPSLSGLATGSNQRRAPGGFKQFTIFTRIVKYKQLNKFSCQYL